MTMQVNYEVISEKTKEMPQLANITYIAGHNYICCVYIVTCQAHPVLVKSG